MLFRSSEPLPTQYFPDYQSTVKNQFDGNTCWAFASFSSLESYLLKNGQPEYNFSERNMMNNHGHDWGYNDGGNSQIAVSYLAKWGGPVYETDDFDYYPPSSSTKGYVEKSVRKHVQDVVFISNKNYDEIKEAIMEYGSVSSSLFWDDNSYNDTNFSHYYNGTSLKRNHAITIVGWDNNFSETDFNITPPSKGAFICKNSWGTNFGDGGYFYVSYYDKFIGYDNYSFASVEDPFNYDNIYQHDPLGAVNVIGYLDVPGTTAWFANVFTASASENEELSAVSFYTYALNAEYDIYTASSFDGLNINDANFTHQKSGTIAQKGYHTIKLDIPVSLTANSKFIVAVKLNTPNFNFQIPIEEYIEDYTTNAVANEGESYIRPDGNYYWEDLSSDGLTNVCLKAFTDNVSETDVSTEYFELLLGDEDITDSQSFASIGSVTGTLTANAYLQNQTEAPLNATLVIALYETVNGKNILKNIKFSDQSTQTLNLNPDQTKQYTASFDNVNIADTSNYKLKIMFWNAVVNCKPYLQNIEY